MKMISILLLSVTFLPKVLSAQPTVALNEYYEIGDVVSMIDVDPSSIHVGADGAGMMWDFSGASSIGGISVTNVAGNSSGIFGTSSLMITLPNGDVEFMAENSTDSYVNGVIEHSTHDTITYDAYDIAKRPFSYMGYYLDSYKVDAVTPLITGHGTMTITANAWGTLKTATGTYNNVLRIRKLREEIDTISGSETSKSIISYVWFDSVHRAPLFQFDSTISLSGTTGEAMYLASPLAIPYLNAAQLSYTGYLINNELHLNGTFENGKTYDVVLYSVIGTKLYTGDFDATGATQLIDIGRDLSPGIYIVSLNQRSDPSFNQVIKVVKQ